VLELVSRLDHDTTFLPTCNLDDAHITKQKVLPLTRGNQFLNTIMSFAGLILRFTHPDLTLYNPLTHKQRVIIPWNIWTKPSREDSDEARTPGRSRGLEKVEQNNT
jgi:hypothetical protein